MFASEAWAPITEQQEGGRREAPELAWPQREALRIAGRRTAVIRAAGWSVPFLIVMLVLGRVVAGIARSHYIDWAVKNAVGGYSGEPHPPPPYLLWLLVVGGSCWVICAVAEVLLARTLAGDYPSFGPWARLPRSTLPQTVRRAAGSVDRRLGNTGGGCLAIAALAIAGPLVVLVWSFFTAEAVAVWVIAVLGATIAHLLTVRTRLRTWRDLRRGSAAANS
ncbi:hypothetical protein [Actinoallomurus sp. NPDC052274]|uniref:hypothetical protein n=1 Tax=Actinoallomurus sp. NPDC052274 TaxID=3155420 RepID=UPI003436856E